MKWIVAVLGVLIVLAFTILLVEVGRRMFTPKPGAPEPSSVRPTPDAQPRLFGEIDVRIPAGARVESVTAAGDRMIAHVRTREGVSLGYVIDATTGLVLGIVRFPEARPAAQ